MIELLKRNRLRITIVLIIASFFFILIAQVERNRMDNWFTALVHVVAYPFQASSHAISSGVKGVFSHYFFLVGLVEENDQLKKRVQELEEESARNKEILIAHERLRKTLDFHSHNPDQKVFAEVIGEVNQGFSRLLVINKGADAGIKKNYAVVAPAGVIGKIQSVTRFQAVVQLITDSNSQFPVMVQSSRSKAMVQGSLDGTLNITRFPRRVELEQGDLVIATGLAGIYPKGFPVGRIDRIDKKEFGLFQEAKLIPTADLNKVEEVAVIINAVRNIHKPLFTD